MFAGMFYVINANHYLEQEFETIRTSSNVKMQQMETIIRDMDSAILIVLSDIEVLNSLRTFSRMRFDTLGELLFHEASATIQLKMNSFYLSDRFYRMVVFNDQDNVIANNTFKINRGINSNAQFADFPYLEAVRSNNGRSTLIGLHTDTWGNTYRPEVISYVMGIEYTNMGFIEVQMTNNSLRDILVSSEDDYDYIFFTAEKDLLFSTNLDLDPEHYLALIELFDNQVQEITEENGSSILIHASYSENGNFYLLTISNTNVRNDLLQAVLPFSALLLLVGILVSIAYISLTANQLTKPIHELQHVMENTRLDNIMETEMPAKISDDEMEALYITYKDLLERLNASMLKEERLSVMQLQAQFDLLQAQVNPHFIYNVLNVLSGRGLQADDNVICEICSDLAKMLRYSTNTKDKYATVQQEVEYLQLYLSILKYRHEHKLNYEISTDPTLESKILPRIVLQQFVENSVYHGSSTVDETITISVLGESLKDGWRLQIIDNGSGISTEKLTEIQNSMAEVRERLSGHRHHVEMEIGGMGLVNSYARLYILYPEEMDFSITSKPGQGTTVTICIKST